MAGNLYNGVALPALPAYDVSAFPYAYISKNTAGTAYILTVAAERPVYGVSPEDSTVTGVYHYGLSGSYLVDGEAWVLQVEADGFVCTADGIGSVIWTNTDILKTDGSVYLAASKPLPRWDRLQSFMRGLALGLSGKPLPTVESVVIAVQLDSILYIKKAPAEVSGGTLILWGGEGE